MPYCGGSCSFEGHRVQIKEEFHRESYFMEVFSKTHQLRSQHNKEMTEGYTKALMEAVVLLESVGSTLIIHSSPFSNDDFELWIEKFGGIQKGRIFRFRQSESGPRPIVRKLSSTSGIYNYDQT